MIAVSLKFHVSMQVISLFPRIILFPNFVDDQRAENIKRLAEKHLHKSGVALRLWDKDRDVSGTRTSSGAFLTGDSDPTGSVAWLDDRIQEVTGIPKENYEVRVVSRRKGKNVARECTRL
jgi:prolyl 4-hydroxylase